MINLPSLYRKYPELLLVVLAALIFLVNLDVLFVNIMEARNFITAREMLTHDNWIFTTMNAMPRYQKPPLPTWLTAISAGIFGIENLFAYRLPAALVSIYLILMFYRLHLLLKINTSLAFGASIILMTSFYVFFAGREGQWDIFTHGFMLAGCYYFILMLTESKAWLKNAVVAGVFLGASFLSKGPVSLYALFLPFLVSYGLTYKFESVKVIWKPVLVFVLVGLATGIWWTLLVHYYDPEVFTEIAAVESDRWFNYNIRPFYYYWSFFTQSGIWTLPAFMGLLYWYLKPRVSNLKAYKFFLFWTLTSLVLLSIIPEKKSRYLLPVLIPLAATTAFYAEVVIHNFRSKFNKWEKLPVYLNFGLLCLISLAAPLVIYYIGAPAIWEYTYTFIAFGLAMLLMGIVFIYALKNLRLKMLFGLQAGLIVVILVFGFPLLKLIEPSQNSDNVAKLQSFVTAESLPVYEYNNTMPELTWHYGEPIPVLENHSPSTVEDQFILLIETDIYPEWQENFKEYRAELAGSVDLNPTYQVGTNSRLMRDYYLLTKQEP